MRFSDSTPYVTTIALHHILSTEKIFKKKNNNINNYDSMPQIAFEDKIRKNNTYNYSGLLPTTILNLVENTSTQKPDIHYKFPMTFTTSRTISLSPQSKHLTLSDRAGENSKM